MNYILPNLVLLYKRNDLSAKLLDYARIYLNVGAIFFALLAEE